MQQTTMTLGVAGFFLALISLVLCAIFVVSFPGPIHAFSLGEFRQGISVIPPMLPLAVIGGVFSVIGCRSHYGKPALCASTLSIAALLFLFVF